MKLSRSALSVADSVTMAVSARAKQLKGQGIDVVSFGAGEPDFDTPLFIKDLAKKALDDGNTKYAPAAGLLELRKEIANKLSKDNSLTYEPSQVVVTCGAKHAVYEAIHAVVDPGDEVLIPTPYWVSYPEMVKLAGGAPKVINTSEKEGYKLTPQLLEAAITDKTCLLLLNYPSNPGGFCYSPAELAELGEVLADKEVVVISDEIYEKLIYGDMEFQSFAAACPAMYDKTFTINGLSKAYAMTGWRIGYVAGPADGAKAIARMQSHMTSGPATFCQVAAIEALRQGDEDVVKMHAEFAKRGRHIYERLSAVEGVTCAEPTGAFYAFPNVAALYPKLGASGSIEFCTQLLEKAQVACVPGAGFGCDENIRFSFA
ncbi:MAG: pyridoxal phosphate-dependent aminotransferase, partial [Planctomycetes bacterium]|nr:pyridoxal phosphate-dependent aminotransferase [Planctomycetota bacterium]